MTPEDIARILDELGQRLGPSGEYVFGLAVRQVAITAIVELGISLLLGFLTFRLIRFLNRYVAEDKELEKSKPYHTTSYELAYLLGGVGVLILGFGMIASLYDAIPKALNPEYAALTEILSRIVP